MQVSKRVVRSVSVTCGIPQYMVNLNRMRVAWSGTTGGPGVSTFYSTNAATAHAAIREFFWEQRAMFPGQVTFTFDSEGDTIDPLDGSLQGSWSHAAPASVTGTNTGDYALPVGSVIHWLTGSVVNGHRLRGRTFLVPMTGAIFDSDGTIDPTSLTAIRSAGASFVANAASTVVVWSRPSGANAGGYAAITGYSVPDKAAILRSRRD